MRQRKLSGEKIPEAQKFTLALVVCLSEVPVLPEKLLKEDLPSVSRALFKEMMLVKSKDLNPKIGDWLCWFRAFLVKFRAKSKDLNPKLGDWLCRFRAFLVKFRAKSYALNTKLGDWEDRQDSAKKRNRHKIESSRKDRKEPEEEEPR